MSKKTDFATFTTSDHKSWGLEKGTLGVQRVTKTFSLSPYGTWLGMPGVYKVTYGLPGDILGHMGPLSCLTPKAPTGSQPHTFGEALGINPLGNFDIGGLCSIS